MRRAGVRLTAAAVAAAIAAGALVACSPETRSSASPGELTVDVAGETQPAIESAMLSAPATAEIEGLAKVTDFIMGTPMDITHEGGFPVGGATLTRSYATPLPQDVTATFAYWDEDYETWQAVPTTISNDRLTVSATVDHFSVWTDFVSGSQQALTGIRDRAAQAGQAVTEWTTNAMTTASEALHWSIGNIFTERVELPECELPTPNWVIDLPTGTGVNDSVRFCAGHDAANPKLLVLKARANRGFGFPVTLNAQPSWEYNSTSENGLGNLIGQIGNLDQAVGRKTAELLNEGRYVGAGEEISFGIPASSLEGFTSTYLLELPAPSAAQFVMSTITGQIVAWGASKVEGALAAALAIASCGSAVSGATEVGSAAGAALSCMREGDEKIAQMVGLALLASGMQENAAGRLAGKLVGRASVALALLPTAINIADFTQEVGLPRNARALTISIDSTQAVIDESWPITAAGIGPIRLAHVEEDFSQIRQRRYICSGEQVAWGVSGSADDHIGGGERGPWIQVSRVGDVQGDVPAPRTADGITLGSTIADLKAAGYYSNVDSEFWFTTLDGVVLTAVTHQGVVTSLVLGKEGLGLYGCG